MNSVTVAKINKIIDENKTVRSLDTRLSNLEIKFTNLDAKVSGMDVKFTSMAEQMQKFGIIQESMKDSIDMLIERMTPSLKKNEQYDEIKETVEQHDFRLKTVEYTLKKHLKEDH